MMTMAFAAGDMVDLAAPVTLLPGICARGIRVSELLLPCGSGRAGGDAAEPVFGRRSPSRPRGGLPSRSLASLLFPWADPCPSMFTNTQPESMSLLRGLFGFSFVAVECVWAGAGGRVGVGIDVGEKDVGVAGACCVLR